MSPRLVHVQAEVPIRTPRGAKARSQRSRRVAETRFDRTAWGAASSNHTISTIQSSRTAETAVDRKEAVSAGILQPIFSVPGLLATLTVSRGIFGLQSLHPKIPFPAKGFRRPTPFGNLGILEVFRGQKRAVSGPARNYRGFNPRASNCWLHSAGASRSRSTPIPRGKRPSTAARTRAGARNASDIVMLTWRTLHF